MSAEPAPTSKATAAKRWRRRIALALLAAPVLAALGTWGLLGSDAGRRLLIGEIASRLEERTGWRLRVGGSELDLGARIGRLALVDVRLGVPGEAPVLRLERLEAELELSRLADGEWLLRELALEAPHLDLAAPRPAGASAPAQRQADGSAGLPIEIAAWSVRRGAADGAAGDQAGWLAGYAVRGLELRGSLAGGAVEAQLEAGRMLLERAADGVVLPIAIAGRVRGPLAGPWTVDHLQLAGDAIEARLSGTFGKASTAAFDARLDPSVLLPELTPGLGMARLAGRFSLPSGEIELDIETRDFPVAVLEPFLDQQARAALGPIDRLDLDAELQSNAERPDATTGRLELIARGHDAVVLQGQLAIAGEAPSGAAAPSLQLDGRVELLPEEAGLVRAAGRLVVPGWRQLGDGRLDELRLEEARLELRHAELESLADRLGELWPQLRHALSGVPPGGIELTASADGVIRRPDGQVNLRLRPAAGGELRLDGKLRRGDLQARLELDELDPSRLGLPFDLPEAAAASGRWQGTVDVAVAESRASIDAELRNPSLELEGELEGENVLSLTQVELETSLELPWHAWPLEGPRLELPATGHLDLRAASLRSAALSTGAVNARWRVDGALEPSKLLRGGLQLAAEARQVRGGVIELPRLELELASQEGSLLLRRVEGVLKPPPAVDIDRLPFRGSGRARLGERGFEPVSAELVLDAGDATRGVAAVVEARLEAGDHRGSGHLSLRIPTLRIDGAIANGSLRAEVPLALLLEGSELLDQTFEPLAEPPSLPIVLVFDLAGVDLAGFERWTGGAMPAARGDLRGLLRFDPGDPTAATGRWVLDRGRLELPEGVLETVGPLVLQLGERRVGLRPARLRFGGRQIDAGGDLTLRPGWALGDPAGDLIGRFRAEAAGVLDLALLEGHLPDSRMQGVVSFALAASGDPASYVATLTIDDDGEAALIWDRPYVTRFSAPSLELRIEDGEVSIDSARVEWNEGELAVHGRIGDQIDLRGELGGVRYRLDYGLAVEMGGTFHFSGPRPGDPPQPGRLEADLAVDRGSLRRRIDAGRELLDALLGPPNLEAGGAASAFGETELAVQLATKHGIRVKNNLADLQVGWSPVRIEGTLAQPQILGSFEVDPDGRVYAYGQVIRLDRAALVFDGAPAAPPRLDLQMTTSLEDPSLLTPEDQRILASLAPQGDDFDQLDSTERAARVRESVASGLTTYFGDQLASRFGRALGRTQLRYRPLWIFGEADPEARLVLSRDVSRYVTAGVAFDLRQADQQTYLLEVGRLPRLPRLTGTIFSNDEAELGASFQQQITFGGTSISLEEDWPRVSNVSVRCPTCRGRGRKSPRRLSNRALSWREGRPIDPDSSFDLEIEVGERLRRGGYPDPRVEVELAPAGDGLVDLKARIEPGPRAEFVFLGEQPPRSRRETLRDLYRSDYSERASLAEIRETAERVWRSRGHPWPRVAVDVESSPDPVPAGTRRVTITSEPGQSFKLAAPAFEGLPADVESELQRRFLSLQLRAELVAGAGGAENRLLEALASLGYPRAEIGGRDFDPADPRPRLVIVPGPRRRLASVELIGAPEGEEKRLAELVSLEAGAPLVGTELAAAAFAVERSLRERGWINARVRLRVPAPPQGGSLEAAAWAAPVRFEIEAGVHQRLAEVEITGAEVTKEAWVERLAGVEDKRGEALDATQVTEARRELLETRLFDRVQVEVETDDSGQAVLRFDLHERPRYLTAYGLRWEESEGLGGLFDILDRNAGGRGVGLGLRALWLPERRALRLYSQFPKLLNSPLELELFVEGFDEEEDGLLSTGYQLSAQLKWPLDPRTELRSYLRYRRADVIDQSQPDASLAEDTESTPWLGFQIVHDRRDDPFDPRRGYFASADLSGSEEIVASGDSYLRLFAQVDYFLPFGGRWTWAQGARVGYAEVFAGSLPRDVRFFAGGARSLRGYANRSVGPREQLADGTTRAAGGEALLVLHEELRYDFSPAVQGVLFFDAGNVWEKAEDFGEDLISGVGLGVRYHSPIGLLRLDVAHGLDRGPDDEDIELYVGLGHAF